MRDGYLFPDFLTGIEKKLRQNIGFNYVKSLKYLTTLATSAAKSSVSAVLYTVVFFAVSMLSSRPASQLEITHVSLELSTGAVPMTVLFF
jgi:hypothetical protein